MQNAYDHISKDEWKNMVDNFEFKVVRSRKEATFNEGYLGIGILYGITDYGRTNSLTDEQFIELAKTDGNPGQPIAGLVRKEDTTKLPKTLVIVVRRDGWFVYPLWEV